MRAAFAVLLSFVSALALVGCNVSKPYVIQTERVDQELRAGNRGYLKGEPPPARDRTGLKRPLIAIDIDLPEIKGETTEPTRIVETNTPFCPVAKVVETVTSPRTSDSDRDIK